MHLKLFGELEVEWQ